MNKKNAKFLKKIINNDKFINPNFTSEMLHESYDEQFIEIFPRTFLIYDYDLIKKMLKNPLLTSHEIGVGNYSKLIKIFDKAKLELLGDVLFSDAEQHVKLKNILMKCYVKMYEYIPIIVAYVTDAHFEDVSNIEQVCINNDIATPISEKIFLALSGVGTAAEYNEFSVVFKSIRLLLNAIDNNFVDHTNDEIVSTWEFVFSCIVNKLNSPDHSYPNLLSALQDVTSLSEEEKAIMILAFIRAGIENPRSFIVSSVIRHSQNKNLYTQSSVQFLDEVMRYDAPAKITARYISENIKIDNIELPKGYKVWLSFRLANFNSKVFDDPFTFKLRKPNQNLSLGYGPHYCIGKELTYRLTEQVINNIISRGYDIDDYQSHMLDDSQVFRRFVQPIYMRKSL